MFDDSVAITATVPFDADCASETDRTEFMRRAQSALVEAALPGIDQEDPTELETLLSCLNLEAADCDDRGYVVPINCRECAERLLAAGLLDQTQWEIIARWGANHPMNPTPRAC